MTRAAHAVRRLAGAVGLPALRERAREARAAGTVPRLVGRMALRARLDPAPEAAAAAGAAGDGPLADRLAAHVRRARGEPGSGLERFAAAHADRFPGLARAVRQVGAAVDAPAAERERRLDRATDAAVAAVRERTATAAASLRGPVTAVYAFGVLLPLALVGVLPAVAAAGVSGGGLLVAVVLGYDLLLPAALAVATAWLLARRPVAFQRVPVPASHPDRPDGPWRGSLAGGCVAVLAAAPALLFQSLPAWTAPVAAVGGAGAGLAVHYRSAVVVRERTAAMEAGLPDALVAVGRRVATGTAVERAVAAVADSLGEPVGPAFAAAADRGRNLGVGVEAAFCGPGGPLADLPSPRTERAVRTLALAAREGTPAGDLLVETGEHLADLRRVTERSRRETARLTSTLANTAAVFGPLVGGVTVALAAGTAGRASRGGVGAGQVTGGSVGASLPVAELGVAVGVYVLLLAALLTALATGLRHGPDRARVAYRVGLALPAAAAVFSVAVVVGRVVV